MITKQKNMSNTKHYGFRGWFYFRQGWANYFAFLFAAVNTLTVTYFLAIEKYPALSEIFPNFIQYVIIITAVGVPILVAIGYLHWKKTAARIAEIDILHETNPYIIRTIVNTEILLRINLKLNEKMLKLVANNSLTEVDLKEFDDLQKELLEFVRQRKFRDTTDWKYFQKLDKTWNK